MHNIDCFFQLDEIKVFLTTDIQFRLDKLDEFYKRADIIFQDCETSNFQYGSCPLWWIIDFTKKTRKKCGCTITDQGRFPMQKKFCGFVKRGQTFEFSSDLL